MINEALRLLRVYNDLKLKDLAEKLQISASYLSEIESGKKEPSMELISKYSREFDIPVSSIMFFSENMNTGFKKNLSKMLIKFLKEVEENGKE